MLLIKDKYMKIKLTYFKKENKTSKAGKAYESVSIKAEEFGDRFINGFGSFATKDWEEGKEVEVEIETKEYNGKEYLNFKVLTATDKLEDRVAKLEKEVFGGVKKVKKETTKEVEPEVEDKDLPEDW